MGDGEIAVTESQFNEYERLRLERLNSLGNTMSPAHGALINELHNRLIISLTDKADLIGQVNDLKRENITLKNNLDSLQKKYEALVTDMESMQYNATIGEKLMQMKARKKYFGSHASKSLYMLVSSICPGASPEAISQFAPAILAAFFADLDLLDEVEVEDFATILQVLRALETSLHCIVNYRWRLLPILCCAIFQFLHHLTKVIETTKIIL